MPRKTGYQTRSALSTLVLGDPDLGTRAWDTEYDVEFSDVTRREENGRLEDVKQPARASLRTPRSLKKGYVAGQDYEKLEEQYNSALVSYRDLQLQVAALEHRLATVQGNEHLLLRTMEEQQDLIDTLRKQISGMNDSAGQLLGGVERNKSLLTVMNNAQDSQVQEGKELQKDRTSASKRLEALESKIGDMADALVAMSRAQEMMAASAASAASANRTRREVHSARRSNDGRRSSDNERPSSNGQRCEAEKIERLPNPFTFSRNSTFWKP